MGRSTVEGAVEEGGEEVVGLAEGFALGCSQTLDTLDEVSRSAVVLRYYDGLSSKQIGELLDLAPAAIDMRLTRARRVLRDRLGPAEVAPGFGK